jgi:hypothetical protein
MSEFAKQPHPDAAHRERLSREIPGLSPRQVQVWFQNRYVFGLLGMRRDFKRLMRLQPRQDQAFNCGRPRPHDQDEGSTR